MNYKKNILKVLFSLILITGCTPDKYESLSDNSIVDISTITKIVLAPNHNKIIADGNAVIDMRALLYIDENSYIPDYRITPDMLEYTNSSGETMSRYFSTYDASLIGTNMEVSVKLKGTELISDPIIFDIIAPIEDKYKERIVIPIVFHVIQTNKDIESYGGVFKSELIDQAMIKLSNLFNGSMSKYPTGVNASIKFERAIYSPSGKRLNEHGINRITVAKVEIENNYVDFINAHSLLWNPTQYLNIWLISDRANEVAMYDFSTQITSQCLPKYYNIGTDISKIPQGLTTLVEFVEGSEFEVLNSGIIYKLQQLTTTDRSFDLYKPGMYTTSGYNELGYYIGQYLGLNSTCNYTSSISVTDNCDDTIDYGNEQKIPYKWIGENIYFKSENIMDDPTGLHIAISKEQSIRMRWILDNVPERSAWKSTFALTGK